MKNRWTKKQLVAMAMLLSGAIFCYLAIFSFKSEKQLEIDFLDVGQGDAILIKSPTDFRVLIDGGPGRQVLEPLADRLPWWSRQLDLVVLTHAHDDHVAGLIEVIKRYQIDKFWMTAATGTSPNFLEWLKVTANKLEHLPDKHEVIDLGGGAYLEVINSPETVVKNANNNSMVLKVVYGEFSALLMGDTENKVEKELLAEDLELEADVLKLGHHGSDTASSEEFIEAVKPKLAIASVGVDNQFGHPSQLIIKRLERLGVNVKRTDNSGTIRVISDGKDFVVK